MSSKGESAPKIREDTAGLSAKLRLPVTMQAARWWEQLRVPAGGAPGPSDTVVYAMISLDNIGWQDLEPYALHRSGPLALPKAVTRYLLPSATTFLDADTAIEGTLYDVARFCSIHYESSNGVRMDNQLFVVLTSR